MRLAKVLGAIGRACTTAGVLILLFVSYQLWGTGLREAQAQQRLERQFSDVFDGSTVSTTSTSSTSTTAGSDTTSDSTTTSTAVSPSTVPPAAPIPEGEPAARLRIPRIGVDKIVVEGVTLPDLKKGPGHYPGTPLPGQRGNAAIAGHRTTYGAPFNRIDELVPGDEILVDTAQGSFRYVMSEQLIVSPSQVEVLDDAGDNRLTLTSCHPKFSARQRIIVIATLASDEVALPAPPPMERDDGTAPTTIDDLDDIDGQGAPAWPAIVLGALCAGIWLLAWALGRRWRKWPSYAVALPFFLVALFYFFEEFSRLLPSNF